MYNARELVGSLIHYRQPVKLINKIPEAQNLKQINDTSVDIKLIIIEIIEHFMFIN